MTFNLNDIKDYWCIVAVNDDGDDVRIMRVSADLAGDDVMSFANGIHIEESTVDQEWFEEWIEDETTLAGVYKLILQPTYEDQEEGSEDEADFINMKPSSISFVYQLTND